MFFLGGNRNRNGNGNGGVWLTTAEKKKPAKELGTMSDFGLLD